MKKTERMGQVYFFQTNDSRFVKIGHSTNLKVRNVDLRVESRKRYGCVGKVITSISGTIELERRFHRHLKASSDGLEWYRNTPELQSAIANMGSTLNTVLSLPEPVKAPTVLVHFTPSPEVAAGLDGFRWENRMSMVAAVRWLLQYALDKAARQAKARAGKPE